MVVYQVTGLVESVSNTLDDATGDLTRTPVVSIDTVSAPLLVDDSRAVELEAGQEVAFTCTVQWYHLAADTYTCQVADWG